MTVITPEILEHALAQYFGVAPDQVKPTFERLNQAADTVDELHPLVVSQWRERELSKLKDAWEDDFDGVYDYITKEVFPTLPPAEQAKWNNADGLKFLAEQHRDTIQQRLTNPVESNTPQPAQQVNAPGSITPGAGSPTPGNTQPVKFKQSQLLRMTPDEWKQNESAIQDAYATGSVEMDINE
jgi:hypothetical protein